MTSSTNTGKVAYVLKLQGETADENGKNKLLQVGNAIENPSAKFQPAFTLHNDQGDGIGMVIDPTKDGNLILKKKVATGEKTDDGKDRHTYEGICVLFKSLSKAGKVYYRGKNKETGEVYRMFQNDRAA